MVMPQASAPDCAVIIVNYNAGRLLQDCVRSALAEAAASVIVVDNASQDGSMAALTAAITDERLHTCCNERNLGFAAACNMGGQASSARHLLFLNPDSVLVPGSLQTLTQVLDGNPQIGMVGARLCNPDGTEQAGGRRNFPRPRQAFIKAFGISRLARFFPALCADFQLHNAPLPDGPTPVEAISGACMLVKREAIADVGWWDEGYFLHCEDLDWCMRFQRKGWQVVFVPDATVIHDKSACSHSRPFFVNWHKHHGMVRFYRKFFRQQYSTVLWWLVVVGVWLRFGLICLMHALRWPLQAMRRR